MPPPESLLSVRDLHKEFNLSGGLLDQLSFDRGKLTRKIESVKALNGISLDIVKGEALCLVGESGCGKTTVGRTIIGLLSPSRGEVHYQQRRIDTMRRVELLPYRKKMQMIFQNPYASLNPRKTVEATLLEPVRFHFPALSPARQREKIAEVMASVGVDTAWGDRFPHEFSGGQRQRISIARALMVDPEFIVADEPISALDVSIQAQVLNLLMQAREERGLTYLFITHDLSVVEHFGTRVAVMYLGRVCELGATGEVFSTPRHPYTRALLSAIPKLGRGKSAHIKLRGEVP
ncbi:MAG: ABC transporter ATP-binding protein, partial [bacterium]